MGGANRRRSQASLSRVVPARRTTEEEGLRTIGDLVVLAAGMGSRFGGAKQAEGVGPDGEWLLEYSIYDAIQVGFERIILVIQEDQEGGFRDRLPHGLLDRVAFAHQRLDDVPSDVTLPPGRTKPWGTGHAVLSARHVIDGRFAVINADDFYGRRSFGRLAEFANEAMHERDIGLVGFEVRKTLSQYGTVSRGICRVNADGLLVDIVERVRVGVHGTDCVYWDGRGTPHAIPHDARASMNMWAFPADFIDSLEQAFEEFLCSPIVSYERDEFFLPTAVANRMKSDAQIVRVLPTDAEWMGLTFREDLDHIRSTLDRFVAQGDYPADLWRRVE